jgi:YggT family protein
MTSIFQIILMLIGIARFLILIYFIMSWLVAFNVLNTRQQFVAQVWYGLNRLMQPVFEPIRRILPPMGGIDFSPIVVLIGLEILRIVVTNNMYSF